MRRGSHDRPCQRVPGRQPLCRRRHGTAWRCFAGVAASSLASAQAELWLQQTPHCDTMLQLAWQRSLKNCRSGCASQLRASLAVVAWGWPGCPRLAQASCIAEVSPGASGKAGAADAMPRCPGAAVAMDVRWAPAALPDHALIDRAWAFVRDQALTAASDGRGVASGDGAHAFMV